MTESLSSQITTEQLMALDYRYNYSDEILTADWDRLVNTFNYKTGSQFKPGMKLCQHFFPNFWKIENAKGLSFEKAWTDPVIMDKVREWGLKSMSKLWMSWIRRAVYMQAGLPNSSFYRPHFAKQIISMTHQHHGVLFDPCCGWGGRLLGTVSADWIYIGCEPNPETYKNLMRMVEFLRIEDRVWIYPCPVEDFDFSELGKADIVLTSPPFFNLEVYAQGSDQSYNKHSTYNEWKAEWWIPLIDKCLSLNPKISAWNVMNTGKCQMIDCLINHHDHRGYSLQDTVGFQSPLNNIRKLKNKDVTYLFQTDNRLIS